MPAGRIGPVAVAEGGRVQDVHEGTAQGRAHVRSAGVWRMTGRCVPSAAVRARAQDGQWKQVVDWKHAPG